MPLIGAQEGLVLTVTYQDYIVHWTSSISEDSNTGLVDTTIVLPYQEGDSIRDAEASTEILKNRHERRSNSHSRGVHGSSLPVTINDRGGVPDLSVSGDNFDLVVVDPHDPTTTSEPEAPMQSLNQLPMVTNLAGTRSA
jgi:hypothetical protein